MSSTCPSSCWAGFSRYSVTGLPFFGLFLHYTGIMIDLKLLTENLKLVEENNRKRGKTIDTAQAVSLAMERTKLIGEADNLRAQGNAIAAKIPKASKEERDSLVVQGREVKERVKELDAQLDAVTQKLESEIRLFPNILRDDVPEGKSEEDN